ncbi:MAG: hypothetical protein Q7S27_07055 [Nanoarchaeota archaeon]|nr:hypothetical protein [Nanoarchaeota archaeon]
MKNTHILGDSDNNRISRYDKDLARKLNEETEKQIRQEEIERRKRELEEKRKKKIKENEVLPSPGTETSPITLPTISPLSLDFKYAFFLGGEFGKQINEKVQEIYGFTESISKVIYDDQNRVVTGSTPFYVTAVNEIFQEQYLQFRTATQADLEKIIKSYALDLRGKYEDTSLVLRKKQNPNVYVAEDLFDQFKSRDLHLKEDSAYVIPLFTLKLRKDDSSEYKLSFDITDSTIQNYFEAPILLSTSGGYFNSVEMDEKIGLPTTVYFTEVAEFRKLGTRDSGLVRLFLGRSLVISSYDESLSGCFNDGRIVIVSNEDPSKLGVNIK